MQTSHSGRPVLVFDFDGVIANSLEICVSACRNMAAAMGGRAQIQNNPFAQLEPLTFEALAQTCSLEPLSFANGVTRMLESTREPAPLFPGMDRVLESLSKIAEIHILSASSSALINRFLEHHGLSRHVAGVSGRDIEGSKAEKLQKLQARTNLQVMVGDATSDMKAARVAGVLSVGVSWGWQSAESLVDCGASYIAREPAHLLEQLEAITCCQKGNGWAHSS